MLSKFNGHTNSIQSISISSDNKYIASGSSDQTIIKWDINGNKIFVSKKHTGPI